MRRVVIGFISIIVVAGCVSNNNGASIVVADGTYAGAVTFVGTDTGGCVPTTVTLTYMADELIGATGNALFSYPAACTAEVDNGDATISCPQSQGSETDCQAGGSSILGVTTLTVTATETGLTGVFDSNVTMTNPGCTTTALCSGTGTVTFAKM